MAECKYPDGTVYTGAWNDQGQRHGYGQIAFMDGSKYWGLFDCGVYEGLGVMTFQDGSRYGGEFKQGKFHGLGVFQRADNMMFEGEFRDGKIRGMGLVTFADGTHGLPRNEGYFESNQILRREKCSMVIHRAREAAKRAAHPRT
ncbi:MORN repeat-containing protein 4 homolog [Babylonia areolata]|uniref:MORN repeat-containing protein 4 homolog n=1 Tax=Babylonia areolata TaxID=304850 RepID=UPI003FD4B12B